MSEEDKPKMIETNMADACPSKCDVCGGYRNSRKHNAAKCSKIRQQRGFKR